MTLTLILLLRLLFFSLSLPLSGVLSRAGQKHQGGTSNVTFRALRKPRASYDQIDKAPVAIHPEVLAVNAPGLVIEFQ